MLTRFSLHGPFPPKFCSATTGSSPACTFVSFPIVPSGGVQKT